MNPSHKCYLAKQANSIGIRNIFWSDRGNGFIQAFIGLCVKGMVEICHLLNAGILINFFLAVSNCVHLLPCLSGAQQEDYIPCITLLLSNHSTMPHHRYHDYL
jgi:hypothetical protein